MKIKGEFIMRELVGEILLVPVGQTALQFNGMITLNPVSAQIWRSLEQGAPYEEILQGHLGPVRRGGGYRTPGFGPVSGRNAGAGFAGGMIPRPHGTGLF